MTDLSQFEIAAEKALSQLYAWIDGDLADQADVDLQMGVLTITLNDGRQFVVNKHGASQQIWISSPVSGAHYCVMDNQRQGWVNKKNEQPLFDLMRHELQQVTGVPLKWRQDV